MFSYKIRQFFEENGNATLENVQTILDEEKMTPDAALLETARQTHPLQPTICELLLEAKADTEAQNEQGDTPLLVAAKEIYTAKYHEKQTQEQQDQDKQMQLDFILKLMSCEELNMRAVNNTHQTLRHFAYLSQYAPLLRLSFMVFQNTFTLPDKNGNTLAHYAVLAKKFKERDLEATVVSDLTSVNIHGETALHLAVNSGEIEKVFGVIKVCLQRLSLENIKTVFAARDEDGNTALHLAVRLWDRASIVIALAECFKQLEINPDIQNNRLETPLYAFVNRDHDYKNGSDFALRKLMDAGANPEYVIPEDKECYRKESTPLQLAERFQSIWMTGIMIDTPANWIKKYGYTREEFERRMQETMWGTNESASVKIEDSKCVEEKNIPDKSELTAVRFHRNRATVFSERRGLFSRSNMETVSRPEVGVCVNFKKFF